MAYEVLARKWRPKQFEDVVGQDHVTRTLQNAIETNRVAHAYLFVGPRGIGKTSLARIFARALNCEKGPTAHPCGECSNCREISAGNSIDVLEIDGASNNGIDQVRDLREQVQFAPTHSHYKIIIIDEVHMLSTAAFNALLKTLEEPPPHVKFIFATTEGDKVLPTIISRCQRFDLHRIPTPLIVQRLRLICNYEKITIDDDALLAIARGAEGGMRDALSSLDQLISFKGGSITEDDVTSVFGLVSRKSLEELEAAILKGDMPAILNLVAEFDAAGKDMRRLTVELMAAFRNLLVYQYVGDKISTLDATPDQIKTLSELATLTTASRVLQISDALADMESRLRYALSVRTLIEMTLMRCARLAKVVSLEEVLKRLAVLKDGRAPEQPIPAPAVVAAPPASAPAPVSRPRPATAPAPRPAPAAAAPAKAPSPTPATKPGPSLANDPSLNSVLKMFNGQVVQDTGIQA